MLEWFMDLSTAYQIPIIVAIIACGGTIVAALLNGLFNIVFKKRNNESKYSVYQHGNDKSTQIGVQYVGMTPEQAAKQTTELFLENFPKLQVLAREEAEKRANELCVGLIKKLGNMQVNDYSPFHEPDVQFVLYEAQKQYARFGDQDNLDVLIELISDRIQNDKKNRFKRITDDAIAIAVKLTPTQLDCLSSLFVLTKVRFNELLSIEDLKQHFSYISNSFKLKNIDFKQEVSYLNSMGCIQIELPNIERIYSKNYNLPEEEIKGVLPKEIQQFNGDYGISEIGIILAIVNAEKKTTFRFDPHIWIPD